MRDVTAPNDAGDTALTLVRQAPNAVLGVATAWCRAEARIYRRAGQRGVFDPAFLDNLGIPQGLARAQFDAVVLGCGSLSHVLDPRERRLLRALDVLSPTGPLLASFLWMDQEPVELVVGRAARWGRGVGRTLARLRGLPCDASPRLSYQAARGFAYTFTRSEIEQMAQAGGRRVIWERDSVRPSNYASFVRP